MMKHIGIFYILSLSFAVYTAHGSDFSDHLLDEYLNNAPHFWEMLDDATDLENDIIDAYIDPSMTLRALPAFAIVQLLVELGAVELLQENFYLSTNRPAQRSLLDRPIFQPQTALLPCPAFFNTQLFLSITPQAQFTRTSTQMTSYIATQEQTLIEKIETIIDAIKELSDGSIEEFNVRTILNLVGLITLVERNLGFMFQGGGRWDRLQLRVMFPLYYHERNFFLSNLNTDLLSQELGFTSESVFEEELAIADRLGIGDTRIEFGIDSVNIPQCNVVFGLRATIPTAFSIAKGLAGSTFYASDRYPLVDFETIYEAAEAALNQTITPEQQAAVFDILQSFFLDIIKRTGAALLDNGLGNEGHFGLGCFADIDAPLDQWIHTPGASDWHWHNRFTFEFVFKKVVTRFFINKDDPAAFDRNWDSQEQAEQNLLFLQNEIIARVILLGLPTEVQPGAIGTWMSTFVYEGVNFNGYFGIDSWGQGREHHDGICAKPELVNTLDLHKSVTSWAFQEKILAGFSYVLEYPNYIVKLGIDADATIFKTGVGRDYTADLCLDITF
jgi:hypothetical protein